MRQVLVVVLVVLSVLAVAWCASAEPLVAGTAAGKAPVATKTYVGAVHLPVGFGFALWYPPSGSWQQPLNATRPYSEWPDPGRVSGRKPAMARDICIIGSRQLSTTATVGWV